MPTIWFANVPAPVNSSTRLLPVSATQMLPDASTAMPSGSCTWPGAEPLVMVGKRLSTAPLLGLSATIRLLLVSVTSRRFCVGSYAMSHGLMNWPLPDPRVPTLQFGMTVGLLEH